jgi:hypothetical protein
VRAIVLFVSFAVALPVAVEKREVEVPRVDVEVDPGKIRFPVMPPTIFVVCCRE